MNNYIHALELDVRDYECDLQGIVNNAVYQNYLEHARVSFLRHIKFDYAAYAKQGILLVATRIEMDFKAPLQPAEKFFVGTNLERVSRLRFAFVQDIVRLPDQVVCVSARVTGAAISASGRPMLPVELESALDAYARPAPTA